MLSESKPVPQHSLGIASHGPGLVAGGNEQDMATQLAVQEQHEQYITPRRRRGGWGTPQPVPEHLPGDSAQTAHHTMPAGLAGEAKQAKQVTLEVAGAQVPKHVLSQL